jgi:hypothetical protein
MNTKINNLLFFFLVLAISSLACTIEWVGDSTPTPNSAEVLAVESVPSVIPTVANTQAQQLPTQVSPTPTLIPNLPTVQVVIQFETVNIRTTEGQATGLLAIRGQNFVVIWREDGYGEIQSGAHKGFLIWRGCTNDPGGLGCQPAE